MSGIVCNEAFRFVKSLGAIGNAKEAREAVSKLINMRVPPIANAIDYEAFLTEFSGDFERLELIIQKFKVIS
jgi:hypothetical protein